MNRNFRPLSIAVAFAAMTILSGIGSPAYAQMMGGALNPANPMGATPGLHPPSRGDEAPPPALPGGSGIGTTSPSQVQIDNENPTKVLFTAINHGNYAEARAAISRGANLSARNALGETPIEMSVALNRNDITFMLLSMRAADGGGATGTTTTASPVMARGTPIHTPMKPRPPPMSGRPAFQQAPVDQSPGIPNPSAGFLGFGGSS